MRTLYYFLIGILLFYIDIGIGLSAFIMHIGKFELEICINTLHLCIYFNDGRYCGFGVSLCAHIFRRND